MENPEETQDDRDDEECAHAVRVPLNFLVATKTTDGKWTVKAAFATEGLARAYEKGLRIAGVTARAMW